MVNYTEKLKMVLGDIDKLISTPESIRNFILDGISNINCSALSNTEKRKLENLLMSLSNISDGTFAKQFKIIYNQACTLAVSSLEAILEEMFCNYAMSHMREMQFPTDFKISIKELVQEYNFEFKSSIARIILAKDNSINFQDLKSTVRTFRQYLDVDIKLPSEDTKCVIFYQQCRHLLLHKNGIVDDEFVRRVDTHNVRKYKKGDQVCLDGSDWSNIKLSFCSLVQNTSGKFVPRADKSKK